MEAQVWLEEHAQPYTENTHLKPDATRESINYIRRYFFLYSKRYLLCLLKTRQRSVNYRDYVMSSLSLLLQTPLCLIIVAESQPNFERCVVYRTESLKIKICLRINAMRICLFT